MSDTYRLTLKQTKKVIRTLIHSISIRLWENVVASNEYRPYLNQVCLSKLFFAKFQLIPLASNSIDMKARKRIEELFEITDEIINAYNEINEKYVHQIYRKYKQLQAVNRNLKEKLDHYHCTGCKCTIKTNRNEEEEEDESSAEEEEDDNRQKINSALPSSTTNSIITRSKKNNRLLIFISLSIILSFDFSSIHHTRY